MVKFSLSKAVLVVILATGLSKLLGFVREMAMAAAFGTGTENDSFLMALTLPNIVVYSLIAWALTTTLIPVYTEVNTNEGEAAGILFVSRALNIVTIFTLLISILGFIFADQIIGLIALGFSESSRLLTIQLFRILISIIVFSSIVAVFTGYLQANMRFLAPALVAVPMNLIIIGFLRILSDSWGVYSLAWGYLIGTAVQILVLVFSAMKAGYKYRFSIALENQYIKKMTTLILPAAIGGAVGQISQVVDRFMAAGLQRGSISALHFSFKLILFPHDVFILSLSTVVFPVLSQAISNSNPELFRKTLGNWIQIMFSLVIPVTVGFVVLQIPLTQLVYERGSFDQGSTLFTAAALQFYALGLPAFGLRNMLNRAYYAVQDTRTPMINGIIAVILNIILNILLIKPMGHAGLALATSLSGTAAVLLLVRDLSSKKLLSMNLKQIVITGKILASSLIMGFVVQKIYLPLSGAFSTYKYGFEAGCIVSVAVGAALYFSGLFVLFLPDIVNKRMNALAMMKEGS